MNDRKALEDVISNPWTSEADRERARQRLNDLDKPAPVASPVSPISAAIRTISSDTATDEQKDKARDVLETVVSESDPDSPSYRPRASKYHEHLDSTVDLNPDANGMITLRNSKSPLWNPLTKVFDRVPQPDVVITAAQFERLKSECVRERNSKTVIHYDHESLMTDKEWISRLVRGRRMLTAAGFKGHEL